VQEKAIKSVIAKVGLNQAQVFSFYLKAFSSCFSSFLPALVGEKFFKLSVKKRFISGLF
jgi:hypothetical protein